LVLMDWGIGKVTNYEQFESTPCATVQQVTIHRGFCVFLGSCVYF
jgi:hypothetical protein